LGRVPQEQASRRRQKALLDARKRGREATAATLAACEWTFLITNAGDDLLSTKEVIVLYRARWQIELLCEDWDLATVLERFARRIRRIACRNPRSKTGAWELLRNPDRLDYVLS
jgi:hypothetical protein